MTPTTPALRARARLLPVEELRTERPLNPVMEDHFCLACDCTKSGWADVPNMVSEWCYDPQCPCHEDIERLL